VRTDTGEKQEQGRQQDSPFYRIEQRLNELGFERNPWEPPLSWIRRMGAASFLSIDPDTLLTFLALYYQGRFGKKGLTAPQQAQLEREADMIVTALQDGLVTEGKKS
jgi:hypothetical protein